MKITTKNSLLNLLLVFFSIVGGLLLIVQWLYHIQELGMVLFLYNYFMIILVLLNIIKKGFINHFLLFSFYICFFIFLMGQKLFMIPWREHYNITLTFAKTVMDIREYTIFATLLFVCIVGTYYAYFYSYLRRWKLIIWKKSTKELRNPRAILPIVRCGFWITFLCALTMQLMIVITKGAMFYTTSYLVNVDVPVILKIGNVLFPFFSLTYLSMLVKKKETYMVLFMYIFVEGGMQLLQHRRALFATSVLFIVWYLLQFNKVEKVNISLMFKMLIMLSIIIGLFYSVEAVRTVGGTQSTGQGIFSIVEELMVSTGGSDSVIANTIQKVNQFPKPGIVYLLYPFVSNPIANLLRIFFTGKSGGSFPQGMEYLEHNDDFSHWISYLTEKTLYVSGHGMGSSYIAEVYLVFGIIGVVLFTIILGGMLNKMQKTNLENAHIFKNVIIMFVIQRIFTLPRSGAFGWVGEFVYLLIGMLIIYPFYYFYVKRVGIIDK